MAFGLKVFILMLCTASLVLINKNRIWFHGHDQSIALELLIIINGFAILYKAQLLYKIVASFSWQSCGQKSDPIKIISLDAYSNQTKTLYVTGRGKSAVNVTAPIKGEVLMQKKFFWGWTTIPCVDQIGTCTYEDVCSLSHYTGKCPEEFVMNHLPCKCPILEGQYAAKRFPIDLNVLPQWIEEGRYRIRLKLSRDGEELLCLLINITF